MKNLICIAAVAALALISCEAAADDSYYNGPCCRGKTPKWYLGLNGGAVFLSNMDFTHPGDVTGAPEFQDFHVGYAFGGELGYRIYPNIRAEFEVRDQINQVGKESPGVVIGPAGGTQSFKSFALMGNMYYDWHNSSHFTPYLGAGIGEAENNTNLQYTFILVDQNNNPIGTYTTKPLSAWALAYQFMAGVNYDFVESTTPFEVSLGYRYFDSNSNNVSEGVPGFTTTYKNSANILELGLKVFF